MQNLTKTEEWFLGSSLGFPFEYTVSCDNPRMKKWNSTIIPELCVECGSTRLSILASDRAGVEDPRVFNRTRPRLSATMKVDSFKSIVNRLVLPKRGDYDTIIQRRVR